MQEKVHKLFQDQIIGWPMLGENWSKLETSLLKHFEFEGFSIRVQFNPKRIISSAARLDQSSIEKRPCFLCTSNRPPEEDELAFGNDYEILCNPFPIFKEHFTIAKTEHSPQVIDPEFSRLLDLSKQLPELVVFYNAPGCGASAPDHMHFQAGNRGFMPIEDELGALMDKYGKSLLSGGACKVTAVNDGLRHFLVLESDKKEPLELVFAKISDFMRQLSDGAEPMLNILALFREKWQILIFPREKHRPWQFFEEGEKNILLSPASVDMGGVMILPLEKDFLKISREDIVDIFTQVGLSDRPFNELISMLGEKLS